MFLILLLLILKSEAIINPYGPTVAKDFVNCISKLVENNFKKSGLLIFAVTNNVNTPVSKIQAELLKRINERDKFTIQILSPENEVAICDDVHDEPGVLHMDQFKPIPAAENFIIILDDFKDFPFLASKIIRSRSWNPRAKFIVLLFKFVVNDTYNIENVEKILTCLYKFNVINIVVIVPKANDLRKALIYGWKPYDPPKYCGYFNETAKDRSIVQNECDRGFTKYETGGFESKIPISMNGCTLYIMALERQPFVSKDLENPNLEKIVINQMLTKYKHETKYEIITGFRGERENVGEWNGALKELVSKRGQILLGGIFPDFDVHEDFECSSTYLADSYTWVVPRAFPSPRWVALTIIFKSCVWYTAIIGFIVCGISWTILGKLSGDSSYNKSLRHCFLNTWICSLGFSAYIRPVTKSLRIFFIFFNLYCILFLTAYQTKLIDVLRNPTFEYQIRTVEELVESGLKFGGFEELHDLFYNSSDPFDNYIGEKWIEVNNISNALIDVAIHRNFSVLCSRLQLAHISSVLPELSDSLGNYRYYAFDRDIFTVPLEMVALRGYAFMKNFSNTLNVFKQNGLNEAVRRHFRTLNMRRRAKLLRSFKSEETDIVALSVQHLQGGFLALAFGYITGFFVFVIEILINSNFMKIKIQ